jgi:hypothetical protein
MEVNSYGRRRKDSRNIQAVFSRGKGANHPGTKTLNDVRYGTDVTTGYITGGDFSASSGTERCRNCMVSKKRVSCLLLARQSKYGHDS